MPKIRILIGRTGFLVYDKKNRIFPKGADMYVRDDSITVEFPLKALNFPDFVLAYARARTASVAPDKFAWRVLKVDN